MQITIETKELNQSQMELLMQIINPFQKPYQPELPFEGAVIDTSLHSGFQKLQAMKDEKIIEAIDEKPKRTRRTKAEIEAENAQNTQEVVSEVVQEEIVASDAVSVTHSVSFDVLKEKAQQLVQQKSVGREKVKEVINKYAERMSDVSKADYPALMADFEALEG